MSIVRYASISIAGLLAGAAAGCIGGLLLGLLVAMGYHRHGPADPGDAPVYVAVGLMQIGAFLGAIAGSAIAVTFCSRSAKRQALIQSN
jgi:hypothetical protein